jgi:anthranilate phosphoribosyltransferase
MKNILNHLFEYKTLDYEQAKEILINVASGQYSEAEIAAFLSVFIMRTVKVDELKGFRDGLLELCLRVDLSDFDTIDLCGTGGDGKNTFNISTISSFVVAGAGVKVAKHGNYGVSSSCGSSNVLEYLGYTFTTDESRLKKELDKAGICFLHAPLFHKAMKNVAPVRKNLGIKTFFNILGPMVNPSFPNNQIVGVFSLELARLYGYLYQLSGKKYTIIHALDGFDEISLTGPVKLISNDSERICSTEELGFQTYRPEDLFGGKSVADSAKICMNILEGEGTKAQNDVVLVNSAMALQVMSPEKTYNDCLNIARKSLEEKQALKVFNTLINL